jgi:TetR/AcrR family transcriptional repressor of mexJK operon
MRQTERRHEAVGTLTDVTTARAATGRIDKHRAVLTAAFTIFANEGYAHARVDQIAAKAGVAKATVYNHFGDKETLFREAITALSDQALADNLAAVATLTSAGDDLTADLNRVGGHLIDCYCSSQSRTLRQLLYAEAPRFPDLLDLVHDRVAGQVTEALADRLARLTLAGGLNTTDPALAAEQFTALLTRPAEDRSRMGTREVPRHERESIAMAATATFLRAFGAQQT